MLAHRPVRGFPSGMALSRKPDAVQSFSGVASR
jgi:hypothetical protein